MARKSYRGGRIGEEIKRIISDLLLRELKDPRFTGFVSVTDVRSDADGSFATVYVTMMGQNPGVELADPEKQDVLEAFRAAKGLIRKEISGRLRLRHAPDLRFVFDESEAYGRHIEKIIGDLGIAPADTTEGRENDSLETLAEALLSADVIALFPHEHPDGDTLGTSIALCLAMRHRGKECVVVLEENIPGNLFTLDASPVCSPEDSPESPDLAVLIDVSEATRIGTRENCFRSAKKTMCIDHHLSGQRLYDYNYIEPSAAATAEIIFELLEKMDVALDEPMARALYVGLVTDTGKFQYSNTTCRSHQIAAALLAAGADPGPIYRDIYENDRLEKLLLENRVVSTVKLVAGERAAIACLTMEMMDEVGAEADETDGIVERLRTIRGVEVSVFLRELGGGRTKASLRSKNRYDVSALAATFGGGGHVRAAGFTLSSPMDQVRAKLEDYLERTLEQ